MNAWYCCLPVAGLALAVFAWGWWLAGWEARAARTRDDAIAAANTKYEKERHP